MDGVQRRHFLVAAGALLAVSLAARAEQPARLARIGILAGNRAASPHTLDAFLQGLRDLGYVEGRNIAIEYRDAEGRPERLPALTAELLALKVGIVFAPSTPAALAVKHATKTVPVVFAGAADPVRDQLVTSLAHPGGNVTGLSNLSTDLVGKRLQQLTQAAPLVRRVAVLWHQGGTESTENDMRTAAEVAARSLRIQLQLVETQGPTDFDRAFSEMTKARADALTVLPIAMFSYHRRSLVDLAAKYQLPAAYPAREYVDAGGLMSYGADLSDLHRRAAIYVDRILKGAKPGDLPIEQPTKFELAINLKTAKALGLTIPQSLLLRADEVIQ